MNTSNSKRVIVTDSAGFIGYHLSKSLLYDDYEVLGLDNMNDYYNPNVSVKEGLLRFIDWYEAYHR